MLAPYFKVHEKLAICDKLDLFQSDIGSEVCLELHNLVLNRAHKNCVYAVVVSLIRNRGDQSLGSSLGEQGNNGRRFVPKSAFRPFFNRDHFPFAKKISVRAADENHGLFFSVFLREETFFLDLLDELGGEDKLDEFDMEIACSKLAYYAFLPLAFEDGNCLQGRFALPLYDYYEGVADQILTKDLWTISGSAVASKVGAKGEIDIRMCQKELLGWGQRTEKLVASKPNLASLQKPSRMFVDGGSREDFTQNLSGQNCPVLYRQMKSQGY